MTETEEKEVFLNPEVDEKLERARKVMRERFAGETKRSLAGLNTYLYVLSPSYNFSSSGPKAFHYLESA